MCSALTTVPCGCVGRKEERKKGCEERRKRWLANACLFFLVAAFRYDQNKQRTSEAKGRLPTVLVSLFAILFISFCCCWATSQTHQESRWRAKQEEGLEDTWTGKQTGHAAEHRVHLGFNLCCVSWVRTCVVYRRKKFRDCTRSQPKNRNAMTQISLVLLQMLLLGV